MQTNISTLTLSIAAAGALAANRFVTQVGAYPAAAGGACFGVTRTSAAASGDLVPVDVQGTAIVEAGDAISAVDTALMVGTDGRVVPLAGLSKTPVGRAMGTAAAAGDFIEVLLVPSAGLSTPAA